MNTRSCKHCGKAFKPKFDWHIYCHRRCSSAATKARLGLVPSWPRVNSGIRGGISELRVAADLLEKGYEVFRSVSQSCSCDLAILKDGKLLRIEVRTVNYNCGNGKIYKSRSPRDKGRQDHFAWCYRDHVEYEPELPE